MHVLLARRKFDPWKDHWYFPSGFVEYGEDIEATARREIEEETGLVVDLGPVFGIYSYFDDPRQHGIITLYRAFVTGGTLTAGDDASEVGFFAADGADRVRDAPSCACRVAGRSAVRHPAAACRSRPGILFWPRCRSGAQIARRGAVQRGPCSTPAVLRTTARRLRCRRPADIAAASAGRTSA